jgi:hypothetical protein
MADRRLYAYFAPVSTRLRLQTHIFSQVDDRGVSQGNSALGHHFHEIAKAELEPEIPPDAEDDDLRVEMAALEKILNVQHSGSRPPKGCSRQICRSFAVCTRTVKAVFLQSRHGEPFLSKSLWRKRLSREAACQRKEHAPCCERCPYEGCRGLSADHLAPE